MIDLARVYEPIPGFFDHGDFYTEMVQRFDHAKFVEIGTWMGRSSAFLAGQIVAQKKQITLDCVDHFQGSETELDTHHALAKKTSIEKLAAQNLRPFWETKRNRQHTTRVDNLLKIVPLDSVTAASQYANHSLDFVFIDGGHTYEEVVVDITAWRHKVRAGGVLAGHDYHPDFPGVRRAVFGLLPNFKRCSIRCWMVDM
jgi:predicted O-methyltransferase YrrM